MNSFTDRFLVFLCKITSRLPFWAIFAIADVFYVLIYYVIRYRRSVVHENLVNSFPEKSPEEIKKITKKYYHHLADLGLETIKYFGMTEKEFDERFKINNLEIYEEYFNQGKSFILAGMHYNNWEWSCSMQRFLDAQYLIVYNPLTRNKVLERFILDCRERFGAKTVPFNNSARTAIEYNKSERPGVLVLFSDQAPPPSSQFWTIFLNQETAFFAGIMKIAVKTNQPVVMHHTRKVGRGRYEVFHYKLVEDPTKVKPEEIMVAYAEKLEEIIREEPQYWLWTHRRWKYKRLENIKMYEG